MWVFLNDSYLSIIKPTEPELDGMLLVRARIAGDIERVFPEATVDETEDRDYRFRAAVPRQEVADAMSTAVLEIDYYNFKSSVKESDRHDEYMKVWSVMHQWQQRRVRSRRR